MSNDLQSLIKKAKEALNSTRITDKVAGLDNKRLRGGFRNSVRSKLNSKRNRLQHLVSVYLKTTRNSEENNND